MWSIFVRCLMSSFAYATSSPPPPPPPPLDPRHPLHMLYMYIGAYHCPKGILGRGGGGGGESIQNQT